MALSKSIRDREQRKFAEEGVALEDDSNLVLVAGKDDTGKARPLRTNSDGELKANLEASDIQIGAVEIKNKDTDDRAEVTTSNELKVTDPNSASIKTNTDPVSTFVSTAVTLTSANTAYKLPSSEQATRKAILIYNGSDTDVYIGSSSVTTSTGILLPAGGRLGLDASANIYAVCGSAGKIVRVLEMK